MRKPVTFDELPSDLQGIINQSSDIAVTMGDKPYDIIKCESEASNPDNYSRCICQKRNNFWHMG